nr:DUF6541 family protein [Pseudonocardia acidicola]
MIILLYVAVLWLPGGTLGHAAGLRGWSLVTVAPLLTYAVAGFAGPVYSVIGIRWSPTTFALTAAGLACAAYGIRLLLRLRSGRRTPRSSTGPRWSRAGNVGVAVTASAAVVVGVLTVLGGIKRLSSIPQDWDAVFHANGIRWIADTGDGGLYAMAQVNWYEGGVRVFYPNAYHLVAAVVYQLSGADIPTVLNAHTVLIPGLIALGLVGLVHRMGGRPILAGATALAVVSTSAFYDTLWRGPLLPFATGVAMTPLIVILVLNLVDAAGVRAMIAPGFLFAMGVVGLLCLHPAVLISGVLFTLPALVQRWWRRPRLAPRELVALALGGVVAAGLSWLEIGGALSSAGNLELISWPANLSANEAIGVLLTFSHAAGTHQWGLAATMALGLLGYRRLGELRWLWAVAAVFGALFVIAASTSASWAHTLTSIWWNDRWRLIALAALPMCVIVGHGVAETQRVLAAVLTGIVRQCTGPARRLAAAAAGPARRVKITFAAVVRRVPPEERAAIGRTRQNGPPRWVLVASCLTSAIAVVAFTLATTGLDVSRDQQRMSRIAGDGPAVSQLEVAGMRAMAQIVPAGSRVLNDRGDGSAWMYALTGIRPVAGHYDAFRTGPDATLLAQRFRDYATDPGVRAAVRRLDIRYVFVGSTFLRPWAVREPGLTGLYRESWLRPVYGNGVCVLYELTVPPGARPAGEPDGQAQTEPQQHGPDGRAPRGPA